MVLGISICKVTLERGKVMRHKAQWNLSFPPPVDPRVLTLGLVWSLCCDIVITDGALLGC